MQVERLKKLFIASRICTKWTTSDFDDALTQRGFLYCFLRGKARGPFHGGNKHEIDGPSGPRQNQTPIASWSCPITSFHSESSVMRISRFMEPTWGPTTPRCSSISMMVAALL